MRSRSERQKGQRALSRRDFLRGAGLAGLGAALAAAGCQPKTVVVEKVVTQVVKETVKETVVVAGTPQVVEKEVTKIVEKQVEKEVEKVITATPVAPEPKTIRYWLPPTTEQVYREKKVNEFMDLHPDITVKMEGADPSKYGEATQLLFKSGDPPDVFWKFGLSLPEMLSEDLVQPYPDEADDYITGAYPSAMFLEGVNMSEGRLYGFWPVGTKTATRVLYCNDEIMEQAGVTPPTNWTELREVAKKITDAGAGQSYGIIVGGKSPWDYTALVGALAMSAGPMASAGGEATCMDWTEARMTIGDDYFVSAIELLDGLIQDGSLFPGYSTISHTEARAGLASNWAGMYMGGWWDAGAYNTQFPDFRYTVAAPPVFDGGKLGYNHGSTFVDRVYVSKETKAYDAIAKFLNFKFGPAYQEGWARNGWFTALPEANTPDNLADPKVKSIFEISDDIRAVPMPISRNVNQAQVSTEFKAQHPNFGEILEGVFSGQIAVGGYKAQAEEYAAMWRAELERAIDELKERGVDVSIDDWIFPNWEPDKDYTADMYNAL
jgi:multiple sugar transport system substrate-binding protein